MKFAGNFFRVMVLLLAAAAALGFFSGCSKKDGAPTDKLVVVLEENIVGQPLIAIAKEKGYFREYGLEIEPVTINIGAIEALDANKADILPVGIIPSLSFATQGSAVRIIGGTASGGNYIIAKQELAEKLRNDQNFESWKGKKFGIVRLSTSEMVTRYSLGKIGFDLKNEVTLVEIDSYPNIIEGVRKGQVDIGSIDRSYAQQLAPQGLDVVYPMTRLLPDYVCCRVSVSGDAYKNKRTALVKFLKGVIRAYKDYTEDHDATVKLLAKASRQDESYVYNVVYNPDTYADRNYNPEPNLAGVRNIYETLRQWGYVADNGVKAEDIVDISLFKEALDDILKKYPNEQAFLKLKTNFEANSL